MNWLTFRTATRFKLLALFAPLMLLAAIACAPGEATSTPPPIVSPGATEPGTPTPGPSLTEATSTPAPVPSPVGALADGEDYNFRLLISDDRLAIGDFSELLVTIDRIGVQQGGESGSWIEFEAPVDGDDWTVDLTKLQGDNAQEILRVQLADGAYTKIFIHIGKDTEVSGVLTTGDPVTLKLPSSKLQIVKPFEIVEGGPAVDFVFDIAVVAAGNVKSPKGIKYLLLPVIGKSGPHQSYHILDTDAPTADAGADQAVATAGMVQLDGSGSSDPENDLLAYTWTLSAPEGSSATLSDANIVNPTFAADVDGEYVATLVVNDGTSDSAPDTVEIAANP